MIDNTKLDYLSSWDIDQLVASDIVPVGSGTTGIYVIVGTALPEYAVQFQPTGSSFWYDVGTSSTDGTLANLFTVSSFIGSGLVNITVPTAGTARYFVWADRMDYS